MAVGFHKINSSAARSKIRQKKADTGTADIGSIKCRQSGSTIWSAVYGWGVVCEDFVSDSDNVKCEFESGETVMQKGCAVRRMINDAIEMANK